MSESWSRILHLIEQREVRISAHGYEELAEDNLLVREVLTSVHKAVIVEDYADYPKGPTVLVLQADRDGNPIHVVWGIPSGATSPAVLVTAYRPDPARWSNDFLRRLT